MSISVFVCLLAWVLLAAGGSFFSVIPVLVLGSIFVCMSGVFVSCIGWVGRLLGIDGGGMGHAPTIYVWNDNNTHYDHIESVMHRIEFFSSPIFIYMGKRYMHYALIAALQCRSLPKIALRLHYHRLLMWKTHLALFREACSLQVLDDPVIRCQHPGLQANKQKIEQ